MKLLGWTLSRSTPTAQIARQRASQEPEIGSGGLERLNLLETRLERLEMDQAERQLAVLSALEKVLHQLRARESKRARENGDADPVASVQHELPVDPVGGGMVHPSAALASRFRRW